MAKQSNTIGHILIELNTAVNVPCHWSDKNRVQGKSRLKPFECVYIAKVGKFFAPSASNIFFFIFAHNTLYSRKHLQNFNLFIVRNLTHRHIAPPTVPILTWIRQESESLFPICTQGDVYKNYSKNWEASIGRGYGHLDQLQAVLPAGRHKWWNTGHYCF